MKKTIISILVILTIAGIAFIFWTFKKSENFYVVYSESLFIPSSDELISSQFDDYHNEYLDILQLSRNIQFLYKRFPWNESLIIDDEILEVQSEIVRVQNEIRYDRYKRYLNSLEYQVHKRQLLSKYLNRDFKTINSKVKIENKTSEIVESGYLTTHIQFHFRNENFHYIKTTPILKDKQNWKPGELLDFDVYEYISFALGNPNILNIHIPEKITLEYYLLAENTVGFSNLNIEPIPEEPEIILKTFGEESPTNLESLPKYGVFIKGNLPHSELSSYGELIYHEDITKLWKEGVHNNQKNKKEISEDYIDWTNINLENVSFFIPPTLEIQDGIYKEIMDAWRSVLIRGNKPFVAQPVGTNEFEITVKEKYARVLFETRIGKKGDFQSLNSDIRMSAIEKEMYYQEFKRQFEIDDSFVLTHWYPIEIKKIKNLSAIHLKYDRKFMDNPIVEVNEYIFFNNDRLHKLTLSYRKSESDDWKEDFEKIVNSIEIQPIH